MPAHLATIPPTRQLHFVLCDYGAGPAWAERDPADMALKETVHDICTGQLTDVLQVLEVNFPELDTRDVTEDVLRAAGRWEDRNPHQCAADRIAFQRDHQRDMRKHERV